MTEPPIPEPNRPHYAPAAPGSLRTVDTPPGWYKDPAYRARIVKEPRTVLSEMAVTLYEAGTFTWRQFQAALVARIAAWEAGAVEGQPYNYYRLWLAALEDVLVDLRAVSTDEVTMRVQALAQRRQGHDHRPARDRPTHDRHPAHPH